MPKILVSFRLNNMIMESTSSWIFLTIVKSDTPVASVGAAVIVGAETLLAGPPALIGRDGGGLGAGGGRVAGVEGQLGDIGKVDVLEPLCHLRRVDWGDGVDGRVVGNVECLSQSSARQEHQG